MKKITSFIVFIIGSIGIDELEEPLISLGIAQSVAEVKRIVDSVDEDKSGQIEFNEFLHIISSKNGTGTDGNGIVEFFKGLNLYSISWLMANFN